MPLPTGVISMRATRDDSAVYTSYRAGVPAVTPPQRPTAVGPTDVTVLDIPSLRDADTDGGFYVAVRGSLANSSSTWPGCTVQISTDGQATWTDIDRSEEHTSELQSLMRISYAVFCLKKKKNKY